MSDPVLADLARVVRGGILRRLSLLEIKALVFYVAAGGESDATIDTVAKAIGSASAYRTRRAVNRLEARGLVETVQATAGRVATRRRLTLGSGGE